MSFSIPMEKAGYFWLPEKPEERVIGTLKISEPKKITLELMPQSFLKKYPRTLNDPLFMGQELHFKRIHGITTLGPVTMKDCHVRGQAIGKVAISICQVNCILVGANYNKGEDISFSKIRCSMEGLNEWLSISGFDHNASQGDHFGYRTIRYSRPKEITILLPDENMELEFTFTASLETEFAIAQNAYATLKI